MSKQQTIDVPRLDHDPVLPRFRFWGNEKPSASLTAMALASPRVTVDETTATLRMYGPIDSWGGFWGVSAKEVAEALDSLPDTVTNIILRVNCPGGEAWEGLAILNLLRAHPASITAVVDGIAASAASFIVAAMDDRVASPGAMLMIHKSWASAWGCNADEMRKVAGVLDKLDESMADLYTEAAGRTPAEWLTDMGETTWYTANDAAAAGLVDRVEVVPDAGTAVTAGDGDDELEDLDDESEAAAAAFDLSMYDRAPAAHWPVHLAASAAPKPPTAPAAGSGNTSQEGSPAVAFSDEQVTNMRQQLGVSADADEATILAALTEALREQAEADPAANTSTPTVPEGMRLIDADALAALQAGAEAGVSARTALDAQSRDTALNEAVRQGKFPKSRLQHYAGLWEADPEGTRDLVAALATGTVPVSELGHDDLPEADATKLDVSTDAALDAYAAGFGLTKEALIA